MVRDPCSVLREFDTDMPGHMHIRIHVSTADLRNLILPLPLHPVDTHGWKESHLIDILTRDSMIGLVRDLSVTTDP
jgi:nitrile hydratase